MNIKMIAVLAFAVALVVGCGEVVTETAGTSSKQQSWIDKSVKNAYVEKAEDGIVMKTSFEGIGDTADKACLAASSRGDVAASRGIAGPLSMVKGTGPCECRKDGPDYKCDQMIYFGYMSTESR